jgi:hypothetical protein
MLITRNIILKNTLTILQLGGARFMANEDLQMRFLKGNTVLAISVKEDSSRLWQSHRVYAFPNIKKSYPYIANIMKDMYISFMHQGYINRLYKLDNHYIMKPFDVLDGIYFHTYVIEIRFMITLKIG